MPVLSLRGFIVVSIASLALTIASIASVVRYRAQPRLTLAIGACFAAALPGLIFFEHLALVALVVQSNVKGSGLVTFGPALLWVFVGPVLLFWSAFKVSPSHVPKLVNGLRLILAIAWLASSCNTIVHDPVF